MHCKQFSAVFLFALVFLQQPLVLESIDFLGAFNKVVHIGDTIADVADAGVRTVDELSRGNFENALFASMDVVGALGLNDTTQAIKNGVQVLSKVVTNMPAIIEEGKVLVSLIHNPKKFFARVSKLIKEHWRDILAIVLLIDVIFFRSVLTTILANFPLDWRKLVDDFLNWVDEEFFRMADETPVSEVMSWKRPPTKTSDNMNIIIPCVAGVVLLLHFVLLALAFYFLHIRPLQKKAARRAEKDVEDAKAELLAKNKKTPSTGSSGASSGTASSGPSTGSSGGPSKGASDVKSKGATDVTSKGASDVTSNAEEKKVGPTAPKVPLPVQFLSKAEPPVAKR